MKHSRSFFKNANPILWLIAVCICLIGIGLICAGRKHPPQQWTDSFEPEDYFKYNRRQFTQVAIDWAEWPYVHDRDFSGQQKALESEGVIPVIKRYPYLSCDVHYTKDKRLYDVQFQWYTLNLDTIKDDENWWEDYGVLGLLAAPEEITHPAVYLQYDADISSDGAIIEPPSTVTVRDGIKITAKGTKNGAKALTFQNSTGWYQISATWNASIEDMAALLDWIWEHPVDFDRFPMERGDHYVHAYYNFDITLTSLRKTREGR